MSDTENPFATPDAGLVQVLSDDGRPIGMGFLVDRWQIVTCAHVVNVALGRDRYDATGLPSDALVTVTFPLASDMPDGSPQNTTIPMRKAQISDFRPPGRLPADDMALLRIVDPAPPEVGVTVLADIRGVDLEHDQLDVFGAPAGTMLPIHFLARFAGKTNQAWVQIDDAAGRGVFVTGGFSGGRVWSYEQRASIGMVIAVHTGQELRRAFIVPARSITTFLPGVPNEIRRLGQRFCSWWTVYATIFFLLVLTHFLGDRLGDYPALLGLGAGNPILNGFQGLRISSIAVPIALLMLLSFASDYRQHPWYARVPRFGWFGKPVRPAATRLAAALSLLLFAVFPLYTQGHFLRELHTRGEVYIYPGQFGYTSEILRAEGQYCDTPSVHYCTHPDAGIYSTVKPLPGASGGYIDNAYHYGWRRDTAAKAGSVTFFPIIEPVVYIALAAISTFLAGLLAWRIGRTPTRLQPPPPLPATPLPDGQGQ